MPSSFPLLLIAIAGLEHGADDPPCNGGAFPAAAPRWERGGAIIAIDSPLHPNAIAARKKSPAPVVPAAATRLERMVGPWNAAPAGDLNTIRVLGGSVKVLDVFDDGQILLSFGTRHGLRKGDEVFLNAGPGLIAYLAFGRVALIQVGDDYSVARFTEGMPFGLQAMLMNKENPVRKDGLSWVFYPRLASSVAIPSTWHVPGRFERGGAIVDAPASTHSPVKSSPP